MALHRRIERGAWLAGAALLLAFGGARLWAESERARGLELLRATYADPATELAAPSTAQEVDQSSWSAQRARAYADAIARPGRPTGALLIPSIDLEVPIYSSTNELDLNRGAGHIEGTAPLGAEGNVGIAAHRDGFFRGLEHVHIDDDLILEVAARQLRYRIVDIRIVDPTEVHVLDPTDTPSVTLVTCYPFYFVGNAPERYVVRAELINDLRADRAQHDGIAAAVSHRPSPP